MHLEDCGRFINLDVSYRKHINSFAERNGPRYVMSDFASIHGALIKDTSLAKKMFCFRKIFFFIGLFFEGSGGVIWLDWPNPTHPEPYPTFRWICATTCRNQV